jgi:hypothetical protein
MRSMSKSLLSEPLELLYQSLSPPLQTSQLLTTSMLAKLSLKNYQLRSQLLSQLFSQLRLLLLLGSYRQCHLSSILLLAGRAFGTI